MGVDVNRIAALLQALAAGVVVLGGAAMLGVAVRVFLLTSGLGG